MCLPSGSYQYLQSVLILPQFEGSPSSKGHLLCMPQETVRTTLTSRPEILTVSVTLKAEKKKHNFSQHIFIDLPTMSVLLPGRGVCIYLEYQQYLLNCFWFILKIQNLGLIYVIGYIYMAS